MLRARIVALLCVALAPGPPGVRAAAQVQPAERPVRRIGVVIDGPWSRNDQVAGVFRQSILALTEREFDVRFAPEKERVADWTAPGVAREIDDLLADPEVDLVLAMGVLAGNDVGRRGALPKPVVAPFVVAPVLQNLPRTADGTSGVENLAYLAIPSSLEADLAAFRELAPFEQVTFLMNRGIAEGVPGVLQRFATAAEAVGLRHAVVRVDRSAADVLARLPTETEAVYLSPLFHMPDDEFDRLVAGLNERALPSFSLFGIPEVERGVLVCLSPDTTFELIARLAALHVQRILFGEPPSSLAVSVYKRERLTINMRTARAIGVYPSFELLTEADLLQDEQAEGARTRSLSSVLIEAGQVNLDLAAEERAVLAGEQDVARARASLAPQVDLAARGVWIDSDRADASFGSQRAGTLTGEAGIRQVLWSERLWAGLDVERHSLAALEAQRDELRLDVVLAAGVAYLDVLRAKTQERVRRDDLELTRENLQLARVREEVGSSRPSETLRWESRIATAKQAVIDAEAVVEVARIELNRILHRPLEEAFSTVETGLDDDAFRLDMERIRPYIRSPFTFRHFREFSVLEGLARSVELQRLDAAIRAQARLFTSTRRAFFSPEVFLDGVIQQRLAEGGRGELSGVLPISPPNDTQWSVGIGASFDLFTGGAKSARHRQTREALIGLRLTREATRERVEQRIRSTMHLASASWSNIRLSADAAEAARENLRLVGEEYGQGAVSIIELLDAQNAALTAEEAAANAIHDFLVALLRVQRAVNRFDLFGSEADSEAWYRRLLRFFASRGVELIDRRER